jgi:succinyl-CoA synthetase alpha subunit
MIGEIGGQLEADAAKWIKADGNRKPVVGSIAGVTAPAGRTSQAQAIVEELTIQLRLKNKS